MFLLKIQVLPSHLPGDLRQNLQPFFQISSKTPGCKGRLQRKQHQQHAQEKKFRVGKQPPHQGIFKFGNILVTDHQNFSVLPFQPHIKGIVESSGIAVVRRDLPGLFLQSFGKITFKILSFGIIDSVKAGIGQKPGHILSPLPKLLLAGFNPASLVGGNLYEPRVCQGDIQSQNQHHQRHCHQTEPQQIPDKHHVQAPLSLHPLTPSIYIRCPTPSRWEKDLLCGISPGYFSHAP